MKIIIPVCQLGKEGWGTLFLTKQRQNGSAVALKIMKKKIYNDHNKIDNFLKEQVNTEIEISILNQLKEHLFFQT